MARMEKRLVYGESTPYYRSPLAYNPERCARLYDSHTTQSKAEELDALLRSCGTVPYHGASLGRPDEIGSWIEWDGSSVDGLFRRRNRGSALVRNGSR